MARLDGLPLAIELAAARVRALSVPEIGARLADRFALLRGGDRDAPDRHRTLLSVIEWSWELLDADARAALPPLAVFADGFTLAAAVAVLVPGAFADANRAEDAVAALVDQSLVTAEDGPAGIRYRMLETMREFGVRVLLAGGGAGAVEEAVRRVRRWAVEYVRATTWRFVSVEDGAAMAVVRAEEANLSDVLRRALAAPERDPASESGRGVGRGTDGESGPGREAALDDAMVILAALGTYWALVGEHPRLVAVTEAVNAALTTYDPPAHLHDHVRMALGAMLGTYGSFLGHVPSRTVELLRHLGGESARPVARAMANSVVALGEFPSPEPLGALRALAEGPDRLSAMLALRFLTNGLENAGDLEGGLRAALRCADLVRPEDGPWLWATAQTLVAQMYAQVGANAQAARHAVAAQPALAALGCRDDVIRLQAVRIGAAINAGDLAGADRLFAELPPTESVTHAWGGRLVLQLCVAELFLARGDVREAFAAYRRPIADHREIRLPGVAAGTGLEPWLVVAEAVALRVSAAYGEPAGGPAYGGSAGGVADAAEGVAEGADLADTLRDKALRMIDPSWPYVDMPILGTVCAGLGAWGLGRGGMPGEAGAELIALALALGYNRFVPSMAWEPLHAQAEAAAPGVVRARLAAYGDARGLALLAQTRERLPRLLSAP